MRAGTPLNHASIAIFVLVFEQSVATQLNVLK